MIASMYPGLLDGIQPNCRDNADPFAFDSGERANEGLDVLARYGGRSFSHCGARLLNERDLQILWSIIGVGVAPQHPNNRKRPVAHTFQILARWPVQGYLSRSHRELLLGQHPTQKNA